MKYTVVNIVALGNLNGTLDLYELASVIPNMEYEPEQFPGAILKFKEPKVSMLLFKNGKVICSGASKEDQLAMAIYKASKLVHELQKEVKIQKNADYTVVNLVATANLNMTLDLFNTAMKLESWTMLNTSPSNFLEQYLRYMIQSLPCSYSKTEN